MSLIEYRDIIFDHTQNSFFAEKLQSLHYKAKLVVRNAIQSTFCEKDFLELRLK